MSKDGIIGCFMALLIFGIPIGLPTYMFLTESSEHVDYSGSQHESRFTTGTIVKHVLNDKKGMVLRYERTELYRKRTHRWPFKDVWYDVPRYRQKGHVIVRFAVDNTLGIDSAAGGGFLGSTSHYSPSGYIDVKCLYEELRIVK